MKKAVASAELDAGFRFEKRTFKCYGRCSNFALFLQEQCLPVLQVIESLVNSNDPIIHSHMLLSILKKAEVVVNSVPPTTSVPQSAPRVSAFLVVALFLPLHFLLSICSILVTANMPLL